MYFTLLTFLVTITDVLPLKNDPSLTVEIAGGAAINIVDYPYQVALIHRSKLWCGGSLVSRSHVLTAAHCVILAVSPLFVRAGSEYWYKDGSVHYVVYNATYGSQLNEDLAVLRISKPVVLDKTRQPIPIFYRGEVIKPGTIGKVIGWGGTGTTLDSDILQAVDLPYIDNDICRKIHEQSIIGKMMDGFMCAGFFGGTKKTPCEGDSGGPFVIDGRQAGIVSLGSGCSQPNNPGIYIDTAYYNEWITEQISL